MLEAHEVGSFVSSSGMMLNRKSFTSSSSCAQVECCMPGYIFLTTCMQPVEDHPVRSFICSIRACTTAAHKTEKQQPKCSDSRNAACERVQKQNMSFGQSNTIQWCSLGYKGHCVSPFCSRTFSVMAAIWPGIKGSAVPWPMKNLVFWFAGETCAAGKERDPSKRGKCSLHWA